MSYKDYIILGIIAFAFFLAAGTQKKNKCKDNCGNCKRTTCVRNKAIIKNPLWIYDAGLSLGAVVLGLILEDVTAVSVFLCLIGTIFFLYTLILVPFSYEFDYLGITFTYFFKEIYAKFEKIESIKKEKAFPTSLLDVFEKIFLGQYLITPCDTDIGIYKTGKITKTKKTTEILRMYCPEKFR